MKVIIANSTNKKLRGFSLNQQDNTKLISTIVNPGEEVSLGEYLKTREPLYRELVERGFTYKAISDTSNIAEPEEDIKKEVASTDNSVEDSKSAEKVTDESQDDEQNSSENDETPTENEETVEDTEEEDKEEE